MLTWNECFDRGLTLQEAGVEMRCHAREASRHYREIRDRREERAQRIALQQAKDVRQIATLAARPATEASSYPADLLDVSDLNLGIRRCFGGGPLTDRMRNVVAAGIPFAEITPTDGVSRAQFDLNFIADRQKERDAQKKAVISAAV